MVPSANAIASNPLDGFEEFPFANEDASHRVFVIGHGAPVLVAHELPGLSPAALRFGKRLAAEGFRVYLPLLFGEPGQDDWRASYRTLCISREFANLAAGVSAPIVDWLRALAVELSLRHGGAKVGAIGMCLTGAFAIPLILEPVVAAPVAAQPGVPFSKTFLVLGLGRGPWMSQLNVSDGDLSEAAASAKTRDMKLLAIRFQKDRICPKERFDRLETAFQGQLIRRELPGGALFQSPHATLTAEFERAPEDPKHPTRLIFQELVEFLRARLT